MSGQLASSERRFISLLGLYGPLFPQVAIAMVGRRGSLLLLSLDLAWLTEAVASNNKFLKPAAEAEQNSCFYPLLPCSKYERDDELNAKAEKALKFVSHDSWSTSHTVPMSHGPWHAQQ